VASATLVATSALMLTLGRPIVALAIPLYGTGNGIGSVARGTVPLALFGAERYPVLMGRLGFPLLVAMAVSPYLGGITGRAVDGPRARRGGEAGALGGCGVEIGPPERQAASERAEDQTAARFSSEDLVTPGRGYACG
jgi:hypothetical protein